MREVIRAVVDECSQGKGCMLVSVTSAAGSVPRGAGAQMAVGDQGLLAGTIGGGELERAATGKAVACLLEKRAAREEYRLKANDASSLGMICGGDLDLLYTFVEPSEKNLEVFGLADAALEASAGGWLILPLSGGAGFMDEQGARFGLTMEFDPQIVRSVTADVRKLGTESCFIRKLTIRPLVYVFGGGHLSQELVPLLDHLEFRCVVMDDREEFARPDLFPNAQAVRVCDYADLADKVSVAPGDFIVSLTRGHAGDYEVEKFALGTPAAYIGVVGSKTKSEALRNRLLAEGFSARDLDRVTSPIGIPLASDTPAEIAVSIAAQLIDARARLRRRGDGK